MADDQIAQRLQELGITLPPAPPAVGSYVPVLRFGNFVVTSGQLPFREGQLIATGRVGSDVTVEQAQEAARCCVLNAIAQLRAAVGQLDQIKQIFRLDGYVHAAPGFHEHPIVLNAASELLTAIFGERGKHTRVALGVHDMPLNAPVQIALWAEPTGAGN